MFNPGEKLKNLPDRPGVYIFRDGEGRVIYVGKAVSLKNRVRSYFQSGSRQSPKVRSMTEKAADLEYIVTDSEVEALILECNLIKEHRPRYNILLKDDKSYPYLKITMNEEYPRVYVTRRVIKDGGLYFGPYTQVGAVYETLNLIRRLFPFRTCKDRTLKLKGRPCLNHHIRRCMGPCTGKVAREEYLAMIKEVSLFLEGRQEELVKKLTARMEEASCNLEFERAAELRDQIRAVEKVLEKQKIISTRREDQDVVAVAPGEDEAAVMVFFVRGGKLLGRESLMLNGTRGVEREEIISSFVKQYYNSADFIPGEILLQEVNPGEAEVLSRWLSGRKGSKVAVAAPRRGEKKKLLEMVERNARLALDEFLLVRASARDGSRDALDLARCLGLPDACRRIECYDISNIQGAEAVASMAVFEDGKPAPGEYRRFKIKTVQGPDDFASMREVISRRFERGRQEKDLIGRGQLSTRQAKFHIFPDLVIVDGGKGQLSAALEAMTVAGCADIPLFALAKEEELLFTPGREEPIYLPRDSGALYLLQRIRDEAHRFAVTYHRQLRTRRNLKSLLDEIEGIGEARKRALLRAFPTIEAIAGATPEELAAVPGMNRPSAEAVHRFFSKDNGPRQ
ncbi:MAG: excinuclease ABC subunit UvrC [Bacillota bacterium]